MPKIGQRLRDKANNGTQVYLVAEVFRGSEQYPGMILEWEGWNPSTGKVGKRGQVFTTKDWQERWEVVQWTA